MTTSFPPTMTPERWRTVDQILQSALACTRDDRAGFVAQSCGNDLALRHEVSSLLASHDAMPAEFLERAAIVEHGLGSPTAPAAATLVAARAKPRRMVSVRLVAYAAAAGIVLGTITGWTLAHSSKVEQWQGKRGTNQPTNASGSVGTMVTAGRISPHAHWVAYTSSESGQDEVYVDSYPQPGYRIKVSRGGGVNPAWRSDGRELYYWRGDAFIAVPIDGSQGGRPPILGTERVLFR